MNLKNKFMNKFSEPFILKDKSRLHEIYKLRYKAYKSHKLVNEFNPKLLQSVETCSDILDDSGIHFVISNIETEKIVAAYRLNILKSQNQLPYPGIFKPFQLPKQVPFLFYSRLVVNEKYRNEDLANKLQYKLCNFQLDNNIYFGIGTALHLVGWLKKWGFETLGEVDPKLDYKYYYGKSYALIIHLDKIIFPKLKL